MFSKESKYSISTITLGTQQKQLCIQFFRQIDIAQPCFLAGNLAQKLFDDRFVVMLYYQHTVLSQIKSHIGKFFRGFAHTTTNNTL